MTTVTSPASGEPTDPPEAAVTQLASLAATPFVASWIGRAHPGDLRDPDPTRRTAAWAHWFLTSLRPMTGVSNRPYTAVMLPGQFYDPRGTGPQVPPHLEVPSHVLDRPSAHFPDRLAQVGNGLLFSWWLVPEVMAAKRALFATSRGDIGPLTDLLTERRVSLHTTFVSVEETARTHWPAIEELLATHPDELADAATGDFPIDQVADYWPPAHELNLRVEFDQRLRESRGRTARRVGVWRLRAGDSDPETDLGVITPRLTRSSLFADPLFRPAGESSAALLVRALVLRRLIAQVDATAATGQVGPHRPHARSLGSLRAVPARVGEKIPEASPRAAVRFILAHSDPDEAWAALTAWAQTRGNAAAPGQAALTITAESFHGAHRTALHAVRRAEEPARDDINTILPLAWDVGNKVVRLTYVPREDR